MTVEETDHVWYTVWSTGVLVDRRLYQIIFYASEYVHTDYTDEAKRFADSFELLNP